MNVNEIKEQVEEILSFCSNNTGERFIGRRLCAILRDLDADKLRKCPKCGNEDLALQACYFCGHTWYENSPAEPPKPTGEQLKRSCTVESSTCPDPQPAQMICNHAGECKVAGCPSITVHDEVRDCKKIGGVNCPFPDAFCVPWVEPVKALMSTCEGCHK